MEIISKYLPMKYKPVHYEVQLILWSSPGTTFVCLFVWIILMYSRRVQAKALKRVIITYLVVVSIGGVVLNWSDLENGESNIKCI